jgi:hypothetical protein
VMRLLRRGLTNAQIAETLGITLDGAKFHVGEIIQKLGANSREEAVALWEQRPRFSWPAFSAAAWMKAGTVAIGGVAVIGAVGVWAALIRDSQGSSGPEQQGASPLESPTASTSSDVVTWTGTDGLLACPPPKASRTPEAVSIIDWVDAVKFAGISYMPQGNAIPPIPPADLGAPYAQTQSQLEGHVHDPSYRLQDCDATILPEGTVFHEVRGYDPRFRIATAEGVVYESYFSDTKRPVSDIVDIRGRVTEIQVVEAHLGVPAALIPYRPEVDILVDLFLSSEFEDRNRATNQTPSVDRGGGQYRLTFVLDDGSKYTRMFEPDDGWAWPGIWGPGEFSDIIAAALAE